MKTEMSQSRRRADSNTQASEANRENSAKKGAASSTNAAASAPGKSETLTGTGAATLNQTTSNIPMAEPSSDINRGERLFQN